MIEKMIRNDCCKDCSEYLTSFDYKEVYDKLDELVDAINILNK